MELARKEPENTIMTSSLCSGDVVGRFASGEMHYYIFGYDRRTGDNIFTDLRTGEVYRVNTEEEYYFFPNASFSID